VINHFSKETADYRYILRDQIDFDFERGIGTYSPDLDINSAIIKIPNSSGFLIPHHVSEIQADPDQYLDNYLAASLLWKELYNH
jgi:hypothetical protein